MANGGINFSIVIHRFSLVEAMMNALRVCKLRKNCLSSFDQCPMVLSKCIYDSKLPQRKKNIFKVCNKFSPPASKLVA
jgi:hypothetical protein